MDLRSLGVVQDREHSFVGSFRHVVDAQGRVQFPRTLRRAMSPEAQDTLIITEDPDGCLTAYPLNEWAEIRGVWREAVNDPKARRVRNMIRRVVAQAAEARIDGQGRISLPSHLLTVAGISEETLIVGAFDRIELWNPERFDEAMDEVGGAVETSASNLMVVRSSQQAASDG